MKNIFYEITTLARYPIFIFFTLPVLAQQIDQSVIDSLRILGRETHTTGLVVYVDNELILNESFGEDVGLIDAMSATKSVVSLGIGKLLTDGFIKSIDEPVAKYYAEWNQGIKKNVTIRHLLNHTSGMQSDRMTQEIYQSPDFVQLALCADIIETPGTKFFYNNKAVNLLAGIIHKASGKRMDYFIKENIFDLLDMKDYIWLTDSFLYQLNQSGKQDTSYLRNGNPIGMAELLITPNEFAKIGLFVLNRGRIGDSQIIRDSWFDTIFKPGQPYNPTCGLLWWLLYDPKLSYVSFKKPEINKLESLGMDKKLIKELNSLRGNYKNPSEFSARLEALPGIKKIGGRLKFRLMLFDLGYYDDPYQWHAQDVVGISAKGTYGQYLTIIPRKKIVAVRMIDSENYTSVNDDFSTFEYLVYRLIK